MGCVGRGILGHGQKVGGLKKNKLLKAAKNLERAYFGQIPPISPLGSQDFNGGGGGVLENWSRRGGS